MPILNQSENILLYKTLKAKPAPGIKQFFDVLEECGGVRSNYRDFMTTNPIDPDVELKRLPGADYNLCCALLTMLIREDAIVGGSFKRRQEQGQVEPIIDRILFLLDPQPHTTEFSEKALEALKGYYVYALVDPRDNKVFHIGKGIGNRVFIHEAESHENPVSENARLQKIREIEEAGYLVKRLIVNHGLTEREALACKATIINLFNYLPDSHLTNVVTDPNATESVTVEEFEKLHG